MNKLKLKVGDRVWATTPINATIVRINKKYGYTLKPDNENGIIKYFKDDEVIKLDKTNGTS